MDDKLFIKVRQSISSLPIAQSYRYGLWDGRSGFRVPEGAWNFSLHHCVQIGSGAHPASCPVALSLGVGRLGRGAGRSPPYGAGVRNTWSCASTPPYASVAWCSVKSEGTILPYRTFILTTAKGQAVRHSS
jgi:hypothetical protein